MKLNNHRDLYFLIPLGIACLLAFYRFPLFQLDDHLTVIREIAETWRWPAPSEAGMRMANHPLVHHTVCALAWKGVDYLGDGPDFRPERAAQALSLLYALGTIFLVGRIVRRLVSVPDARRMAFLVFGTFTGFIMMAVTISNGMAFAFWGTAALLQMVKIMQDSAAPSSSRVFVLGIFLGLASLMKMTAPVMLLAAVACLMSRRWYYRERWVVILKKTIGLCLICFVFYAPSVIRFPRTLGVNPIEFAHRAKVKNLPSESDLFSFPLASMIKRPFYVVPYAYESINKADCSFWSFLFLSNWNLPIHLPDPPNPYITVFFTLMALLITLGGIFGGIVVFRSVFNRPAYFAILIWPLLYMLIWLAANLYLRQPGSHIRHLYFSIGSLVTFLALCFQFILRRRPRLKTILWVMIGLQTVLFWLMIFYGPFYSFYSPWPPLSAP